jgi:hypothetical protein
MKQSEQVSDYMATHQKTYRYRALPTAAQEGLFRQYAGARRWTFNARSLAAKPTTQPRARA